MSSSPASAACTAVDDRELGVALLGLLQQALGLVEQAGGFERHAQARRDGSSAAAPGLAIGGSRAGGLPCSMRPSTRSLAMMGRPMHERQGSVPFTTVNPIGSSSARVRTTTTSRSWRIRHVALPGRKRIGGRLSRSVVLVRIRHLDLVALAVPPEDGQVAHAEDGAKLVADQVDDGAEVELGDQALLDAVRPPPARRCAARSPWPDARRRGGRLARRPACSASVATRSRWAASSRPDAPSTST